MSSVEQAVVDEHASPITIRADLGKLGQQAFTDPFAGHFDQTQVGDVEHLGTGLVASECVTERRHHFGAVVLDFHVDEVDHDDPTDVAQPELFGDLLGCLHVVVEHGRLEVRLADVLAGVHVDHGQRLGVFDDQRASGRQPHLAVERLVDLLVHVESLEHAEPFGLGIVELDPVGQLGVERLDVGADVLEQTLIVDHHAAVVRVELLTDHSHRQLRLAVEQRRTVGARRFAFDLIPLLEQDVHVGLEVGLGGVLGGCSHDQAVLVRLDPIEDVAKPFAGVVREPLRDAVRLGVRDQHDEPARQRHLLREPGALGADRVLGDLTHDHLASFEDVLDPGVLALLLDVLGVVLHVTAVEHGVLRRGDVDEGRLHPGQHVLDTTEVDVAVDLADVVSGPRDIVLDQIAALEHADLGHPAADLDTHEVAPDRLAVALPALALFDQFQLGRARLGLAPPATTLLALSVASVALGVVAAVVVALLSSLLAAVAAAVRLLLRGAAAVATTVFAGTTTTALAASVPRPWRRFIGAVGAVTTGPARRTGRRGRGHHRIAGIADLRLANQRLLGGIDVLDAAFTHRLGQLVGNRSAAELAVSVRCRGLGAVEAVVGLGRCVVHRGGPFSCEHRQGARVHVGGQGKHLAPRSVVINPLVST